MPKLLKTPFAIDAAEGFRTDIQESTGAAPNSATYQVGFPPVTMQSIASNGMPPKGSDLNGVLYDITDNLVFLTQGGGYGFDAAYATSIGGYPLNARLRLTNGDIVKSTIDGNTNDPNVDMTGWINKEKEQDTINSLIASEGVNILSVYGGVNDFGAALELAFAKAKSLSVNTIKIPADTYTALTSADIELTEPLCLDFDAGVRVNVPNKIHVFNVNQNANLLTVMGRGVAFTPLWDTTDSSNSSVFKLLSRTTSKSLSIDSVCAYFKPESNDSIMFENIINASGLHLSNIDNCTFQARKPILNSSHESGFGYSMGSTLNNTFLYSPLSGTGLTLVNNGEYGCEGWAINGGEILCGRSIEVIDNLSRSYLPPLLKLNSVHMNCIAVTKIDSMSRVAFNGCDIQLKVVPYSESQGYGFDAVFELSGVQSFDISQDTIVTQVFENGATQADALNVVGFYENTRGLNSAFININSKMWIQQARPILKFNTGAQMYGVVNISISSEAMNYAPVVDQSDYSKVNVLSDSIIEVSNLPNGYIGSADTFDSTSGTLTLKNAPFGSFYAINTGIVPNGATINKIIVPKRLGEILSVYFDAQNLILNHTANFLQPTQANLLLRYGGAITFAVTGNDESKVINVAAPSFEVISDLPTSSTSWGQDGAKHYSGGFVYEYIAGTGWVRWAASTF